MKKFMSVWIVMALLVCIVAFAEETIRVDFGDTFYLRRPVALETIELTPDDASEGMVYAASSDELEMWVWKYEMDGATPDDIFEEIYMDEYKTDIQENVVGAARYVTYTVEDEGVGATFICDDDSYYEFSFYCVTDEAEELARATLSSVGAM